VRETADTIAAMAEPPSGDRPQRPPPLPVLPRRTTEGGGAPAIPPIPAVIPPRVLATPAPVVPPTAPVIPQIAPVAEVAGGSSPGPAAEDDGTGDLTRRVMANGSAAMIDDVVELMSAEAEALLTAGGADADERLADLNVRLSLITADVLDDAEDAARYLELADKHPLAARLLVSHGVAASDPKALELAGRMVAGLPEGRERALLQRDLVEAWLYSLGAPAQAVTAATALDGAGKDGGTGDPELAAELRALAAVARAMAGGWRELAASLTAAAAAPSALPEDAADAAALHLDRLADPAAALEVCKAALARPDRGRGAPVHWLRVVDLALDAAAKVEPAAIAGLLERRFALLEPDPAARREAAATRYALAEARRAEGDLTAAIAGYGNAATEDGFGAILARWAMARTAYEAGRWGDAVTTRKALAESRAAGALSPAHAWRALEIADARGLTMAAELAAMALSGARTASGVLTLERLLLAGEPTALVAHLIAQAKDGVRAANRRAALVIEAKLGDVARALELLKVASAEKVAGPARQSELDHTARLARRQRDRGALAEIYRSAAQSARDRRAATALLTAAGALELARARVVEAEELFVQASRQAPQDPAAKGALAALYRKTERWRELSGVLGDLAGLVSSETTKVALLREHGAILAEHLADPRRARTVLEQAQALRGDDPDVTYELAKLYDQARQWDKAIELRVRATELVKEPRRQAALLLEVGQIEETKRNDEAAAMAAYERAARLDERAVEPLRAQAALHRKARRTDRLLAVLSAELARGIEPSRRMQIQLEVARLHEDVREADRALAAYLDVLSIEPDHAGALQGVERIARAHERWRDLANAFRQAPRTLSNLRVLAEALERLGEWTELSTVRQQEIEAAPATDKSRLATALARLAEDKLGDVEVAIRYHQLAATQGSSRDSHRDLTRLLERAERWGELAGALERELADTPGGAPDTVLATLMRLGELRDAKLGKPADAALAYEAVLERTPHHVPALEALERLYERLGRDKDLMRVLEIRAESTIDKLERAQLYGRIAQVKQNRGDPDGAITAYTAAFLADPANREVFTSLEKLCYKHERWAAAMKLYQSAIDLVESGASRAYRLGDLYARRGQVQLQYLGELDAAAGSYVKVVEIDPENDTSVKFLESIYSQKSDWSGLITVYEKRAGLTRDDERRLDSLRRAARVAAAKLRDFGEAARLYQQILDIDASDVEALDALERWYERNADWGKLVEVLRHRLATAPAGDAATTLLKRIAQISEDGLRDDSRAVEHYQRILEIAPANKEALEALGRIYESTEQWAEFVDVTRRQIRVTTDRNLKALLYFKCGSVMEAKFGKEEDAIRYYDAAIKTSPSCLPAVHGLRDLYRRREDWPRVIQTLELEVKLWQDDKERAGVFAQIGRIYEQRLGQPDRAMHYYESALAVDPECLPANQALFEHYFDAAEWQRALPLAQALAVKAMREGDPNTRSEFYRRRGVVAAMTGDARGAAESLIVALEIKPNNLLALDGLLELQRKQPDAWDFDAIYRELDKLYKKRDDGGPFLARVRVAQAGMKEREGDLDQAQLLYAEAVALAPQDFAVLSAMITLHLNMRRWTAAVDAIVKFLASSPPPPPEVRLTALMRQAEIHADCEMEPHRAIAVLREVIRLDPAHEEAYYRLAQEHYLLGRYPDARQAIDRVIELAAAPGSAISPESLARYYYYRGRITEVSGDPRGATSQYRRAVEYDPGYAPPALALARRAAEGGDQRGAETLLIDAAHAAMEKGGPRAAVALQRGLARILLASGDRPAAIEAYRGILGVDDSPPDRVALAEIYAIDDPAKAIAELRKVVDRDIHHAPAYRLLSSFYTRIGEPERAARALQVMEQLGFAEEADLGAAAKLRATLPYHPVRRALDDDTRARLLSTAAARDPFGEVLAAASTELAALYPAPLLGENLVPAQALDDAGLKVAVADIARLTSTEAEVFVGERVPGLLALVAAPRRLVVIDRTLANEADGPRRYLLGWAFEALRGGYAFLHHLGRRQRTELGNFMKALLLPESDRPGPTNEFVKALPKRAQKVIERHQGWGREVDGDAWIDGMLGTAKRGGLLACDDFSAATWMIARLTGEMLLSHDATLALGAVLGGSDLVRFYLSDDYQRLREQLTSSALPT